MDNVEKALMEGFNKLTEPRDQSDAEDMFGLHVAAVLKTLSPQQRALSKFEIDRLLYNIQFPNTTPAPSHPPQAHSYPPMAHLYPPPPPPPHANNFEL